MYIVGIKCVRSSWHFKNVFKKYCASALKWKVIVYTENHGNSGGACLISVMPTVAAGETITVLFPFKETTKRFRGLEKGRYPQLMKLCCILSARHSQNSCPSSRQAIAVKGRRNCQNPQKWSKKTSKQGETVMATSWSGLPLRYQTFYPRLPAGIRQRPW